MKMSAFRVSSIFSPGNEDMEILDVFSSTTLIRPTKRVVLGQNTQTEKMKRKKDSDIFAGALNTPQEERPALKVDSGRAGGLWFFSWSL